LRVSFSLDPLLLALADFFKRNQMRGHLAELRRYWRDRRARSGRGIWTEDLVGEWLAMLRVPPLDRFYPVLDRTSPCPRCGAGAENAGAGSIVVGIFPGGYRAQCRSCEQGWIVLDGK
jgi:hypothetical protein